MLIQSDLIGNTVNKVKIAIDRLRAFEPPDGYYLAFSGGKDSVVIKALADMAGVKYDAHYNVTTVDPPELTKFIKTVHPDVEWELPEMTMRQLIIHKLSPPTRLLRYCCASLKETHGKGRVSVTGVRWAESANRRNNQGLVTIMDARKHKNVVAIAEGFGANFSKSVRGGMILNLDNAAERRVVESCYRTNKTMVNPIIDWTDADVWEFIRGERIPYCGLYDEGCKRLGCVGCPMGGYANMIWGMEVKWPQFRAFYVKTFDKMLEERAARGRMLKTVAWATGENLFLWWTGRFQNVEEEQVSFFEEIAGEEDT